MNQLILFAILFQFINFVFMWIFFERGRKKGIDDCLWNYKLAKTMYDTRNKMYDTSKTAGEGSSWTR